MQYSIAFCMITYERSELVREFLNNCLSYYVECGIDIYIYDSSVGDDTKRLVEEWPDQKHLSYTRMPSELLLYEKERLIFQEYGEKQEYDFVWLSNDSTQYSREDVRRILSGLDSAYDYIVFDNERGIGTREFTDPEELFMSYCEAYHVGASMVNVHTMLFHVAWERYENVFSPTGGESFLFYYFRFLELNSFCALHIEIESRRLSALKKRSVYNVDNIQAAVNVAHAFEQLPDYYTRKWEICRRFNAESLMINASDVLLYRKQGIFTLYRVLQHWSLWKKITYIPRWKLLLFALLPQNVLIQCSDWKKEYNLKRLRQFCKAHARVAIYGAGNHGAAFGEYLIAHDIPFDFYCVTRRKPGKYVFMEHPVHTFDEVSDAYDEIGFVVALSRKNAPQVLPTLRRTVGKQHIFYNRSYETAIREEMGYQAYSAI